MTFVDPEMSRRVFPQLTGVGDLTLESAREEWPSSLKPPRTNFGARGKPPPIDLVIRLFDSTAPPTPLPFQGSFSPGNSSLSGRYRIYNARGEKAVRGTAFAPFFTLTRLYSFSLSGPLWEGETAVKEARRFDERGSNGLSGSADLRVVVHTGLIV